MSEQPPTGEKVLRGIPVSAGVCRGRILVLGVGFEAVPRYTVAEADVPREVARLEQALVATRRQIIEIQRKFTESLGAEDAAIFEAHLLVLEDPVVNEEVSHLITTERMNAEAAFQLVAGRYTESLSQIEDEYLRERVADVRDVASRVLNNLMGRHDPAQLPPLTEPCIIISHDLSPSTTAQLDRQMVLGFATDIGGKTSHTAIMARSLRLPAVVGLRDASRQLRTGQEVLLDGFHGLLVLHPSEKTLYEYSQSLQRQATLEQTLSAFREEAAVTLDGRHITLSANLERAGDMESVRASGAEGVGLLRTEFLYLNRATLPTEEEQYQAYRAVAAALKPQPLVIRTLDLGGDKFLSHLETPPEINPFLGWRAIRFCLQETEVFRAQLRAILRASVEGNVKLMYPMISGLDELVQANQLVRRYQEELRSEGVAFDATMELGAMIEIPSAVVVADALARRVQFFSIGTNDLIQYTLAVDRLNEKITHLYEPTHPAILHLIRSTVDAARRNGIWVGVCGEMAGDPALVPLLLGMGVDELSVALSVVPQIKYLIRRLKLADARELAEFALNCESSAEILARAQAMARQIAPSLFESER